MDKEYLMNQCSDNYLMHYGTKGMKKGQHDPNKRWQSHAVYAQGKPNPNAKVRGKKEGSASISPASGGSRESKRYEYYRPPRIMTKRDVEQRSLARAARKKYEERPSKELAEKHDALANALNNRDRKAARIAEKDLSKHLKGIKKQERQAARAEAKDRAKAEARAEANRKHLPGYQSKVERKAERDARIAKADNKLRANVEEMNRRVKELSRTERSSAKERARAQKAFNEAKKKYKLQKQNLKALKRQMELANVKVDKATKAYNMAWDKRDASDSWLTLVRMFA